MAFIGKKTFVPGEVLTASDVNSINEQSITFIMSDQSGTSYAIGTADIGKTLRFTNAGTVQVTIGTAAGFSVGERVDIIRDGGPVQILGGTGVTLAANGSARTLGTFTLNTQYTGATIIEVAADSYRILGQAL